MFKFHLQSIRQHCASDDAFKCLVALLYFLMVVIFLAFIQVIVHHRMPTNETWPGKGNVAPLPDVILDWLPFMEWGLKVSELCIVVLSGILFLIILTHKYWKVILRRLLTISASIYLMRTICLIATSPTPASLVLMDHCAKYPLNSFSDYFHRAWNIFSTFGMQLSGGRTCGDYIFSGHTSIMTISNLFILTYFPKRSGRTFVYLAVILTSIECTGIIFILLSREHYTIDIIVAMAISYGYFMEYHMVTRYLQLTRPINQNSPSASQFTRKYWRIRLTSPITFYMEKAGTTLFDESLSDVEKVDSYFEA